jgi:hypothetical protein
LIKISARELMLKWYFSGLRASSGARSPMKLVREALQVAIISCHSCCSERRTG